MVEFTDSTWTELVPVVNPRDRSARSGALRAARRSCTFVEVYDLPQHHPEVISNVLVDKGGAQGSSGIIVSSRDRAREGPEVGERSPEDESLSYP